MYISEKLDDEFHFGWTHDIIYVHFYVSPSITIYKIVFAMKRDYDIKDYCHILWRAVST